MPKEKCDMLVICNRILIYFFQKAEVRTKKGLSILLYISARLHTAVTIFSLPCTYHTLHILHWAAIRHIFSCLTYSKVFPYGMIVWWPVTSTVSELSCMSSKMYLVPASFNHVYLETSHLVCSTAYVRYGRICHYLPPVANRPIVSLLGLTECRCGVLKVVS